MDSMRLRGAVEGASSQRRLQRSSGGARAAAAAAGAAVAPPLPLLPPSLLLPARRPRTTRCDASLQMDGQPAVSASWPCPPSSCCIGGSRRRSSSGVGGGVVNSSSSSARRRRGALLIAAAAKQPEKLWDYAGSRVAPASLEQIQALQRRAFGHRNLRTYVVVVADARSAACRAVEAPIEALAAGLAHERGIAVLALDAAGADAARFAARILGVGALPAVLLYPEGAPGCLAYRGADMTAEGLLRAVNKARERALPGARRYELRHDVAPLQRAGLAASEGAARADGGGVFIAPTPLVPPRSTYWGPGKAALWGAMLAASLLMFAWDRGLDERWEAFQLARRVRARKEGRLGALPVEDVLSLLLLRGVRDAEQQQAAVGDQQLGWRPLGAQQQQRRRRGDGGSTGSGGEAADADAPPSSPAIDVEFSSVDEGSSAGGGVSGSGSGGGSGSGSGNGGAAGGASAL